MCNDLPTDEISWKMILIQNKNEHSTIKGNWASEVYYKEEGQKDHM